MRYLPIVIVFLIGVIFAARIRSLIPIIPSV
jgi:hypothetical protein